MSGKESREGPDDTVSENGTIANTNMIPEDNIFKLHISNKRERTADGWNEE